MATVVSVQIDVEWNASGTDTSDGRGRSIVVLPTHVNGTSKITAPSSMSCKVGPATVENGVATKTLTLWVASSGSNLKIRRIQVFGLPHLFTDKVRCGKASGAAASASSSVSAGGKYDAASDGMPRVDFALDFVLRDVSECRWLCWSARFQARVSSSRTHQSSRFVVSLWVANGWRCSESAWVGLLSEPPRGCN
jgi:hypothetical protein